MSSKKGLIYAARVISMVFTPFYLPLVGVALLFTLSYMAMLPLSYKLMVAAIIYLLTILLPTFLIHVYRRFRGWSLLQLGHKRRRLVPYVLSLVSYVACIWFLMRQHIYHFIILIVVAALIIQAVALIINVWWKVSTHTAAIGGVAGALLAFAELFHFNPVWWLCLVLLLSGVLGTARIVLRQHTLGQVVGGFFVGAVCAFATILYL